MIRPGGGAPAPMLLVLSTATWNAYNDWGGPSLYTGGTRVSFERPLAPGFLVKPEPARRKMQPHPDREVLQSGLEAIANIAARAGTLGMPCRNSCAPNR